MKAKKEKSGIPINLEEKISTETLVGNETFTKQLKERYIEEPIILNRVIFDSDKKAAWVVEIEALCNEQGILPEDMIREWKEGKGLMKRLLKSSITEADLIKMAENSKNGIKNINQEFQNQKFSIPKNNIEIKGKETINPTAPRTKQLKEPEKGTNAYFLRHGKFD